MTTPLDPGAPRAPRATATRVPAARDTAGAVELIATGALLGVLVLAIVMSSAVRAVPTGPLVAVAALLLVAVVVLCVETPPDGDPATAAPRPCGLEDASDSLRCGLPAGHTGIHLDVRAARGFADTLDARIGDAGAYYRDGRGRAVPVDDVF